MVLTRVILVGINTRVWLSPQFILQIKIRWSLYHFQTACAREPSLKLLYIYIYIYILRGCMSLRASSSRQYLCAPRTLGCFVPLGWASLFTLTLSTRQGSIQCRYLTPETRGVLCPSTLYCLCISRVVSIPPIICIIIF